MTEIAWFDSRGRMLTEWGNFADIEPREAAQQALESKVFGKGKIREMPVGRVALELESTKATVVWRKR